MNSKKMCQSCGKILTEDNKGTEADNSYSPIYCNYCFEDGSFREDISLEEMQSKVRLSLEKSPIPKFIKERVVMNLGNLKRWEGE